MTADTQMTVSCSIGKTSAAGDVSVGNVGLLSSVVQESELFDSIVVAASEVAALSTELQGVSKRLKAGGKLLVENADLNALNGTLLLGGFVDIRSDGANVVCSKPSYAETAVPLKNDKKKIWTMLANDFVDGDVIDEDSLLREEDMTPAAPAADCGPGDGQVKKRACKNCSCGLKEMEEAEENGEKIKVAQPTGSSCGNCAKGDAFRCASCPYLGTPAFEPGSKPQIKIKEDGSKVLLDLGNEEF